MKDINISQKMRINSWLSIMVKKHLIIIIRYYFYLENFFFSGLGKYKELLLVKIGVKFFISCLGLENSLGKSAIIPEYKNFFIVRFTIGQHSS